MHFQCDWSQRGNGDLAKTFTSKLLHSPCEPLVHFIHIVNIETFSCIQKHFPRIHTKPPSDIAGYIMPQEK